MAKTYRLATVVKMKNGHAWFARMEKGIKKFGDETGHATFLVGPPKADEDLQVKLIEDLVAGGIDALCVVPLFPQAVERILIQARAREIVVISHEAPNQRAVDYDIEAFDNAEYGTHLMDHLASYMGAEGEYAILLGSLTAKSQSEWAKAAIARQHQNYPGMHLVTRKIEDHDDQILAYQKTKELLTTYPHLRGIQALGMTASLGVGRAVEDKKLQQRVVVVGTGLASACKLYLKSGAINSLCFWDPADAGYVMNKLAVMVLEGETVTNGVNLGVPGYQHIKMVGKVLYGSAWIDVTKANVAEYNF